jgi:hypothetical protein
MDQKGFGKGFVVGLLVGAGGALIAYGKRDAIRTKLWKLRARTDLGRRLSALKKVTKESYDDTIDSVAEHYRATLGVAREELDDFARELKDEWKRAKHRYAEEAEE